MKSSRNEEIEVKLRVADLAILRRRLARLGLRPAPSGRVYERNTLFDTPQGGLAKHGQLLRVRRLTSASPRKNKKAESGALLTYKGPAVKAASADAAQGGRYKVRQEFEVRVTDPEQLQQILEGLGLRGWFHYEKYRTSYLPPDSLRGVAGLHVDLDETPIGTFLELEGSPAAIDRVAQLLGYTPSDYITRSYLALHLDQCRRQRVPPGDMVFPLSKKDKEK